MAFQGFKRPGAVAPTAPVAAPAPPAQVFKAPVKQAVASAPPAGVFRGIGNVRARFGAQYFEDGRYWVRLERCKYLTLPGSNAGAFAIETTVLRVLDDGGGTACKPGSTPSQMVLMSWQGWMSHLKAFVCAAESITNDEGDAYPEEQWDLMLSSIFSPENPYSGRVMELRVNKVMKKSATEATPEKDKWFTQHNWQGRVSLEEVAAANLGHLFKPGELERGIQDERAELAKLAQG